jgi:CBS domain containing-hemolysin-like protein
MTATPLPKAEAMTAPPDTAPPDSARLDNDLNPSATGSERIFHGETPASSMQDRLEKSDPPTANPSVSWMQALKTRLGFEAAPTLRDTLEDALLAEAKTASVFTEQERGMLLRILRFGGLRVEDVRVPRVDIIAIDEQEPLSALLQLFAKAEVSRIPVYRDTLDDPRGMIHIKDLMSWLVRRGVPPSSDTGAPPDDGVAKSIVANPVATRLADVDVTIPIANARINRPVLYVPPSMPAVNLLLRMQSTHIHLAIVVDEHGGTDGLVSIEDLVEQIVGEIEDEHDDDDDRNIVTDPRHGLVAAGRTPIKDLEAHLGVSIADEEATEDVTSIGGLIYALIGRIPLRGELIRHPSGIEFEVLDADTRRVKRLKIHQRKPR